MVAKRRRFFGKSGGLLRSLGDETLNFLGFESNVMPQSDRGENAETRQLSDPRFAAHFPPNSARTNRGSAEAQ
jgi:hypothetical protein